MLLSLIGSKPKWKALESLHTHTPYQSLIILTLGVDSKGLIQPYQSNQRSLFDRFSYAPTINPLTEGYSEWFRGVHAPTINPWPFSLWMTRWIHTHTLSIPNRGDSLVVSLHTLHSIWSLFGRFSSYQSLIMESLFHFQSIWGLLDWFSSYQSLIILILGWTYFTQKSNFKGLTKHAPYQSLSNLFGTLHKGITRTHTLSIPNHLFETLQMGITQPSSIKNSPIHSETFESIQSGHKHTHSLSIPNHLHSGCLTSRCSINLRPLWLVHTLSIPNHIHSKMIQGVHIPFNQVHPFETLHEGITQPSSIKNSSEGFKSIHTHTPYQSLTEGSLIGSRDHMVLNQSEVSWIDSHTHPINP